MCEQYIILLNILNREIHNLEVENEGGVVNDTSVSDRIVQFILVRFIHSIIQQHTPITDYIQFVHQERSLSRSLRCICLHFAVTKYKF